MIKDESITKTVASIQEMIPIWNKLKQNFPYTVKIDGNYKDFFYYVGIRDKKYYKKHKIKSGIMEWLNKNAGEGDSFSKANVDTKCKWLWRYFDNKIIICFNDGDTAFQFKLIFC